jgi:hypothetical protein
LKLWEQKTMCVRQWEQKNRKKEKERLKEEMK